MELLPLVCLCLLSCSGDAVRVVVEQDSDAVLPCLISTKEDITGKLFVWKKDDQKENKEVFTYDANDNYPNRGQDLQFTGRVSHFQEQLQNGNASIKITKTKMADNGTYRCHFPDLQPSQIFYIELLVGAAPEPNIKTLNETKHWRLLQCEAHGDPLPTVEWKDSDNKTLNADTPQISERGGRSYITVNVTVTKADRYRCVATQETLSHQIASETYVLMNGSNTELVTIIVVLILLLLFGVVVVVVCGWRYKKKNDEKIKQLQQQLSSLKQGSTPNTTNGANEDTTMI